MSERPLDVRARDGRVCRLPGAWDLKGDVCGAAVRYVIDDGAAALTSRTAFAERNTVAECLDLLRFPTTAFWIEWSDAGRTREIARLGASDPLAEFRAAGAAGALVQADESGRRGEISLVWAGEDGDAPGDANGDGATLSPFIIDFDLDDPGFANRPAADAVTRAIRFDDGAALNDIIGHARFRLRAPWMAYYKRYARSAAEFEDALAAGLRSIAADFPFIAAFTLVLSARNALNYAPSELSRLNASRAKKGKSPLLEHLTVSLQLDGDTHDGRLPPLPADDRRGPRLHHVCGHLVRRGSGVHWRRAHLRGDPTAGMISTRTIRVRATETTGLSA